MNLFKRFETFLIIAIIGIIGAVYAITQEPATVTDTQDTAALAEQKQSSLDLIFGESIRYGGVEGQNALALLKAGYVVETKDFSGLGEFVVSIDGVTPDPNRSFWSFYVNGSQSQVGASQYQTKASDVIEWKIEEIK